MATIAIGKELKTKLSENVTALFAQRVADAIKAIGDAVGDAVYETRVGGAENVRMIYALPPEYFRENAEMIVRILPSKDEVGLTVDIPGKWRSAYYSLLDSSDTVKGTTVDVSSHKWAHARPAVQAYMKVMAEREELRAATLGAAESCKTVNQLVKLWPTVEGLLPDKTREALRKRPKKSKGPDIAKFQAALNASAQSVLLKANLLKGNSSGTP